MKRRSSVLVEHEIDARKPPRGRAPQLACDDPFLDADQVAERLNTTRQTVFRSVAEGRLPQPYYPASRMPRWRWSEVLAAIEATRALPRVAMASRRAAKLARQASKAE